MDDIDRFVTEVLEHAEVVEAELAAARKRSHWMWFMFPQLRSLGRSHLAQHYGLADLDEACAFLAHPTLGPVYERLVAVVHRTVVVEGHTVHDVFGFPDDVKLVSSLTLFRAAGDRSSRSELVRMCTEILEASSSQGLPRCEATIAHVRDATSARESDW